MGRNIEQNNAPTINLTPEARNFDVVQGDNRALMGIRFRDAATSTETAPVYDPIHASEWAGHVLRTRGGTQNAPLVFNNVNFTYTSGDTTMMSNREVQVHIPWDNAMLQELNPPPNRPVNIFYDIWQVTYPDATDSFIATSGDRLYFSDVMPVNTSTASNVVRNSDTSLTITVANPERFSVGRYINFISRLSGATDEGYLIAIIRFIDVTANTLTCDLITLTNGGTEGDSTIPNDLNGALDTTQSLVSQLTATTTTALSQARFRGIIGVRERIYNNANAGNDDTPTNGG